MLRKMVIIYELTYLQSILEGPNAKFSIYEHIVPIPMVYVDFGSAYDEAKINNLIK